MLKKLCKEQKGFTLVELMIVVVILGILVAIAVPIFNKVTGDAELRAAQSNARTIEGVLVQIQAGYGVPLSNISIDSAGSVTASGTSIHGQNIATEASYQYFKAWPQYQGAGFLVTSGEISVYVNGTATAVTDL
jgi:prepilin-type N-terminal cleavage/methylation domain-containing protein